MPTDRSLRLLREAGPRSETGFDEWIDSLDGLKTQISSTPVHAARRLPRLDSRRRAVGLSLAAGVLVAAVAVAVGLTLTAASPPSAYAAAKKALAATAAADSGTITGFVSHDGSSYSLDTTQWNGDSIALTAGEQSQFGPPGETLELIDGGAYVEQPDGTWLHYESASGVGPKVGPMVELAQSNVAATTAGQILALAGGLSQTTRADGSTIYTGTIADVSGDPGIDPNGDAILRIIRRLTNGSDNTPGSPGGYHDGFQFTMTVGTDGYVREISLSYRQLGTGSPATDGSYTLTVSYSRLGSTPPITPPAASTHAPPVVSSLGPACPPPPHGPCGG
jgi:hypothetical protein